MMPRYGIPAEGPHRTALLGDGAIRTAAVLDRLDVLPRPVSFLAKVVRSPVVGDETTARRLESVAELIGLRRTSRASRTRSGR